MGGHQSAQYDQGLAAASSFISSDDDDPKTQCLRATSEFPEILWGNRSWKRLSVADLPSISTSTAQGYQLARTHAVEPESFILPRDLWLIALLFAGRAAKEGDQKMDISQLFDVSLVSHFAQPLVLPKLLRPLVFQLQLSPRVPGRPRKWRYRMVCDNATYKSVFSSSLGSSSIRQKIPQKAESWETALEQMLFVNQQQQPAHSLENRRKGRGGGETLSFGSMMTGSSSSGVLSRTASSSSNTTIHGEALAFIVGALGRVPDFDDFCTQALQPRMMVTGSSGEAIMAESSETNRQAAVRVMMQVIAGSAMCSFVDSFLVSLELLQKTETASLAVPFVGDYASLLCCSDSPIFAKSINQLFPLLVFRAVPRVVFLHQNEAVLRELVLNQAVPLPEKVIETLVSHIDATRFCLDGGDLTSSHLKRCHYSAHVLVKNPLRIDRIIRFLSTLALPQMYGEKITGEALSIVFHPLSLLQFGFPSHIIVPLYDFLENRLGGSSLLASPTNNWGANSSTGGSSVFSPELIHERSRLAAARWFDPYTKTNNDPYKHATSKNASSSTPPPPLFSINPPTVEQKADAQGFLKSAPELQIRFIKLLSPSFLAQSDLWIQQCLKSRNSEVIAFLFQNVPNKRKCFDLAVASFVKNNLFPDHGCAGPEGSVLPSIEYHAQFPRTGADFIPSSETNTTTTRGSDMMMDETTSSSFSASHSYGLLPPAATQTALATEEIGIIEDCLVRCVRGSSGGSSGLMMGGGVGGGGSIHVSAQEVLSTMGEQALLGSIQTAYLSYLMSSLTAWDIPRSFMSSSSEQQHHQETGDASFISSPSFPFPESPSKDMAHDKEILCFLLSKLQPSFSSSVTLSSSGSPSGSARNLFGVVGGVGCSPSSPPLSSTANPPHLPLRSSTLQILLKEVYQLGQTQLVDLYKNLSLERSSRVQRHLSLAKFERSTSSHASPESVTLVLNSSTSTLGSRPTTSSSCSTISYQGGLGSAPLFNNTSSSLGRAAVPNDPLRKLLEENGNLSLPPFFFARMSISLFSKQLVYFLIPPPSRGRN